MRIIVSLCRVGFRKSNDRKPQSRPTQRAADKWESQRFSSRSLALGVSRFDGQSTPAHLRLTQTVPTYPHRAIKLEKI